jgi:hypothetical protein
MPDQQTQDWIKQWRDAISGTWAGKDSMDSGYAPVRKSLIEDFQRQREGAGMSADQAATQAGAFGGDRQALLKSQLINDVNRNETSALANLGMSEADRKWQQITQLLGLMGAGSQVGGSTTTQKTGGNLLGDLLGIAGTVGGFALGGPAGAAVGGQVGNKVGGSGGSRGIYGSRPGTSYYGG